MDRVYFLLDRNCKRYNENVTTYECKKLTQTQAWQAIKMGKCHAATGDLTSYFVYLLIVITVICTMFGILYFDK